MNRLRPPAAGRGHVSPTTSGNASVEPVDGRVAEYLRRADLAATSTRVEPLHGDASSRAYVRVAPAGRPPVVLAVHPEPFAPGSLPQMLVGALFRRLGIPIPAVLDEAADLGILAVEDLGNETLQSWMEGGAGRDPAPLYREAVGYLAALQTRGAGLRSEGALPFTLAFDAAKLTWELDFFRSEFLEAHRGARSSPAAAAALRGELAAVAAELAAEPRVLCHRDYHCRNLMVRNGRLVVIDFQDARLGPGTYDLVSLLRDCYVDLPDELTAALTREFLDAVPAQRTRDFQARFDLMSVQRHLKALGTFGHQVARRGRGRFAEPVPRTLAHLRRTLRAYPRFERLRELLSPHLPELA